MVKHAIVTGGAGSIGSHLVDRLLAEGWRVTVIDDLDPFYPRAMKEANIAGHRTHPAYCLLEGDILDEALLERALTDARGATLVHLAAKVGAGPSVADPIGYHRVNVTGTLALLEQARTQGIGHFVLASSSAVYGDDPDGPWAERERGLHPASPYAATKLAAEQFAQVHAHLHALQVTVLRFPEVYGPRQRPDLAIQRLFRKVDAGEAIGEEEAMAREHVFIGDAIEGVRAAMERAQSDRFEIYNLGGEVVDPRALIAAIEREVGRTAVIGHLPEPPDGGYRCRMDIRKAQAQLGYRPATSLAQGLRAFHAWSGGR